MFRVFTVAPDILGFVSSLTRDNRYFAPLPPGDSLLDGEQRARKLRNMKVQIQDVRPDSDVGHIAFARADMSLSNQEDERTRKRIVKGRMYD